MSLTIIAFATAAATATLAVTSLLLRNKNSTKYGLVAGLLLSVAASSLLVGIASVSSNISESRNRSETSCRLEGGKVLEHRAVRICVTKTSEIIRSI